MKTLDIRDLRIGDYVTTNERSTRTKKGEYYRITAIDSIINLNKELIGSATIESINDKDFYSVVVRIECLEPIPITEELMLKIGFLMGRFPLFANGGHWYKFNMEYSLYGETGSMVVKPISNTIGKDFRVHVDNSDCDSVGSMDIEFLHELQHIAWDTLNFEFKLK